MRKVVVTMSDIQRYKVLTEVIEKKLTAGEASGLLSLSYRHTLRLKHKVKDEGLEWLLRKPLLYPPNKKITEQVTKEIIKLRRELYYDFNIMRLKDKYRQSIYRGRTLLLHISFSGQRAAFSEKVTTLLFIYTQRLSN